MFVQCIGCDFIPYLDFHIFHVKCKLQNIEYLNVFMPKLGGFPSFSFVLMTCLTENGNIIQSNRI